MGADISNHFSQGVSIPVLLGPDEAVVMAPGHEEALIAAEPALAGKIVRLRSSAEEAHEEIENPVGGDIGKFIVFRKLP